MVAHSPIQGHDFVVLGRSDAPRNPLDPTTTLISYNPALDSWRLAPTRTPTPLRRDTTVLPALGWLALAFRTDNPGAWIFHCHIAWHVSQGLSVQFVEQAGEIMSSMDLTDALTESCAAWRAYQPLDPFQKTDSGL